MTKEEELRLIERVLQGDPDAFEPLVLVIFTAVFAAVYFAVWITVYLCVRAASKKLNHRIDQ